MTLPVDKNGAFYFANGLPRPDNDDVEPVVLPLGEGRDMQVGHCAEHVEIYFRRCMQKYYGDFAGQEADQRAFQIKVLRAMGQYYHFAADGECLDAVTRLTQRLEAADAKMAKLEGGLLRLGGKRNAKREHPEYRDDIERCFVLEPTCRAEAVAQLCHDMAKKFGLDVGTFDTVAQVLCGQARDVVVRSDGNGEATKTAIALLVRRLADSTPAVCRPAAQMTTKDATRQAFLKEACTPYAADNFTKADIRGSTAQAMKDWLEAAIRAADLR